MKTSKQIVDEIVSMNLMLDSMQYHAEYSSYFSTLMHFKTMLDKIDDEPYKEYKIRGMEKAIKFMIDEDV
jgi:uncharacterized protein with ATP-grasp and redox domains